MIITWSWSLDHQKLRILKKIASELSLTHFYFKLLMLLLIHEIEIKSGLQKVIAHTVCTFFLTERNSSN